MSASNTIINSASYVWRTTGLGKSPFASWANSISKLPLPFGLQSKYGKLYGWTIHETLHGLELETVCFFEQHLKKGDIVADIGTNIGYFTLQFSTLVGDEGRVVSFEPSPYAFLNLQKAVRGKKNVTPVQKGIFSEAKTLDLYFKRKGDGMASVMYQAGSMHTPVSLIPLRDYPENFDWAKIDVEGAEIEVLKGMSKPTKSVLEVAGGILREHGGGVEKFFSDIEALGYKVFFIKRDGSTELWTGNNLSSLVNNIYIEPVQ